MSELKCMFLSSFSLVRLLPFCSVLAFALAPSAALADRPAVSKSPTRTTSPKIEAGASAKKLELVEKQMKANKWQEAISVCDGIIASDKRCAKAYYFRADCRKYLGGTAEDLDRHYRESLHDLIVAKKLDGRDFQIRFELAFIYNQLNERNHAIAELTEILQQFPSDENHVSAALMTRVRIYEEQEDFVHALGDYERLSKSDSNYEQRIALLKRLTAVDSEIKTKPDDSNLLLQRAAIFFELNLKKRCLEDCDKAIALNPKSVDALLLRATMTQCAPDQDNAKAKTFYDRAVALSPDNPAVYSSRAHLEFSEWKLADAISDYSKAIAIKPTSDLFSTRARMYNFLASDNKKELHTKALADANKAIELDAKNGFAYLERGHAYNATGRRDLAQQDYSKASQLGVSERQCFTIAK